MLTPRNDRMFSWDSLLHTGTRFHKICKLRKRGSSNGDGMLTSFVSFRFWVGYMRKALMATWAPLYSPRQMSVKPPDATALVPRFSSPAVSTAEVGRRSVALQTSPKAVTNFVLKKSIVGYVFARVVGVRFREIRTTYLIDPVQKSCLFLWCQSRNVLE